VRETSIVWREVAETHIPSAGTADGMRHTVVCNDSPSITRTGSGISIRSGVGYRR